MQVKVKNWQILSLTGAKDESRGTHLFRASISPASHLLWNVDAVGPESTRQRRGVPHTPPDGNENVTERGATLAPLLSLSQLMRQNPKDWYKPWEHPHCPVWRICRQRLAGLCHLAFYSRGAISSTEAVESSLGLREFDFEVLLSRSDLIVVTCNPLTNSAATQEGATDRRMQNSSWLSSPPSMDRVSCT